MMNNSGPAVAVSGLQVVRGKRRVIPGLDLEIPAGQVVGLLGPSRLGQVDPDALRRRGAGHRVAAPSPCSATRPARPGCATEVGYVTQAPASTPTSRVRDNVAYFGRAVGLRGAELREAVDRALEEVDLVPPRRPAGPGPLGRPASRGSRLAAALVGDARAARARRADRRARPGAAPRPVGPLPPTSPSAAHSLFVSSHVMDEATRCDRLAAAARGPRARRRHPRRAARPHRGGRRRAAFLALIDAETADGPRRAGAPS